VVLRLVGFAQQAGTPVREDAQNMKVKVFGIGMCIASVTMSVNTANADWSEWTLSNDQSYEIRISSNNFGNGKWQHFVQIHNMTSSYMKMRCEFRDPDTHTLVDSDVFSLSAGQTNSAAPYYWLDNNEGEGYNVSCSLVN
jgi:hypothetical protein